MDALDILVEQFKRKYFTASSEPSDARLNYLVEEGEVISILGREKDRLKIRIYSKCFNEADIILEETISPRRFPFHYRQLETDEEIRPYVAADFNQYSKDCAREVDNWPEWKKGKYSGIFA